QSSLIPNDSVYLGFDSDDESSSSKRSDPSTNEANVDNYDLFDYASEEEVLDSSERGAVVNQNVNANRFVTVDYASKEEPSLLQALYAPQHDSNPSLHRARTTASLNKSPLRQARYVFQTETLNITWPVKK